MADNAEPTGRAISSTPTGRALSFGPFRLYPRQRLLLEAGRPVHIGSRAVDLLIALVERPGDLLMKDELMARVWPTTHVVEGNLKYQIAALRRALHDGEDGQRYLATSPGQGYRFVAEVAVDDTPSPSAQPVLPGDRPELPRLATRLVGRDEILERLASRLPQHRLTTISGPGGIGKTSLAIAAAERLDGSYRDGVWWIDFGRLSDPALVPRAAADALRVTLDPREPAARLAAALGGAEMLLVLNDCAHVIDAVASLAVAILDRTRGVRLLATSREPLRVQGEHICRLGPLEAPPDGEPLDAAGALDYPAVELFVERMAEAHEDYALRDEDAVFVAELCRKLDGIPLAIELAAARTDLGLSELSMRLEKGLQVLKGGSRRVLPRHQTMRAALDWSYGLLGPAEQTVLSRLAIFGGAFTLSAAAAVASDDALAGEEVVDLVLDLVTKSLVVADGNLREPRFRLLATTRAYAVEKAKDRGEWYGLARRHARHLLDRFAEAARSDAAFDAAAEALASETENLRAVLAWAFSPAGDPALGIDLVAASAPIWVSTSSLSEWHDWAEQAGERLEACARGGSRQEMILHATLGMSHQLVRNRACEAHAALARALGLAEASGDDDYALRILHTLWIYHMRVGQVRDALALGRRAEALAVSLGTEVASVTAGSMVGIALHWTGEHAAARRRVEALLLELTEVPRRHFLHRAGYDLHVTFRYVLAHVLWLEGEPDRAREELDAALAEARRLNHPQTHCAALALGGCALALQESDLDRAGRLAQQLTATAQRAGLEDFRAFGEAVQGVVSLRRARSGVGSGQSVLALQRWRAAEWHILLSSGDLAAAAGAGIPVAEVVEEELAAAERNGNLLATPELMRIRGELLLRQDPPDPDAAARCFIRARDEARARGALVWELRATLALAHLERSRGRLAEGRRLLQDLRDRLPERHRRASGFEEVWRSLDAAARADP